MKIDIFNTDKKYDVILMDYLWKRDSFSINEKELFAMKPTIKKLSNKNCAFLMWTNSSHLKDAIKLIREWGFKYKTCAFAWIKTTADGQLVTEDGDYTKENMEICLLAMRGHRKSADKTVRQIIMAQQELDNEKPLEIRDRIVKLFGDVPRIELFARRKVDGWDCWGNEA